MATDAGSATSVENRLLLHDRVTLEVPDQLRVRGFSHAYVSLDTVDFAEEKVFTLRGQLIGHRNLRTADADA